MGPLESDSRVTDKMSDVRDVDNGRHSLQVDVFNTLVDSGNLLNVTVVNICNDKVQSRFSDCEGGPTLRWSQTYKKLRH